MRIPVPKADRRRCLFWALLALGIAVRVWRFGTVPAGLNQDEAFAGYEAFSLLHYGIDSAGYHNPVYLVAWGSGMNALESYLMMPFIALLGLTRTAIRLPQLLCGCLSLPVFYLFLKELYGRRTALFGLGLLAVCPWHIMLCRWGLESNLAPFFFLLGLYGFARGLRAARWWVLSAAAFGVSLYAYAVTWVVVPLTLALLLVCVGCARPAALRTRWLAVSAAVLFLLALPLLLFLLINRGLLPEIVTPLFSIPRLPTLRAAEVSLRGLVDPRHWRALADMLFAQRDSLLWNSTHYGLFYYYLSVPFLLLGAGLLAVRAVRRRGGAGAMLPLAGFAAAAAVCLLISNLNVNKGNLLHLYTLLFITVGVDRFYTLCAAVRWQRLVLRAAQGAAAALLLFSCLRFGRYYFTGYNAQIGAAFHDGTEQAVAYIRAQGADAVWVESSIPYPLLLFYEQTPVPQFRASVEYAAVHGLNLAPLRFGRYTLEHAETSPEGCELLLISAAHAQDYAGAVHTFGTVAVVGPPECGIR